LAFNGVRLLRNPARKMHEPGCCGGSGFSGISTSAQTGKEQFMGWHVMILAAGMLAGARAPEVARLRAHFDSVNVELREARTVHLASSQRRARVTLIGWLREYRESGRFPRNDRFSDRAMPFFRDSDGVLCAMAYLIERAGRRDLVDRIALTRNNAFIAELAEDPELRAWLDSVGLSVAEAGRIQPTYPPVEFRIRLTLVAVAPDTVFYSGANVRLGVAPTSACAAWDSTRTVQATLRVVITRDKKCGDEHPVKGNRSPLWLPLTTPTSLLIVVGPDSATIRLSAAWGVASGVIPLEVDPPLKFFVLPQYAVGQIPYGSALVRCIAGKYPASLCEGFADALPLVAGFGIVRPMQYWSVGALPPYHDPTVTVDPSVFRREVISLDALWPEHFDRMVERSAQFTGLFLGAQVQIIPAVGSRVVCDSGACRPMRADTTGRPF
jgi:hypothetical protein